MSRRQRILIAHSNKYFGSSIWSLLIPDPEFEIVGMANDLEEAVNMTSSLSPDLILVDLSDSETYGLRIIQTLHVIYPYLPIVTFVPVWTHEYSTRALDAGATSCLTESDLAEALLQKFQKLIVPQPLPKSPNFGVIQLPNK